MIVGREWCCVSGVLVLGMWCCVNVNVNVNLTEVGVVVGEGLAVQVSYGFVTLTLVEQVRRVERGLLYQGVVGMVKVGVQKRIGGLHV